MNASLALLALACAALMSAALWPLWHALRRAAHTPATSHTPNGTGTGDLLRAQWQELQAEQAAGRLSSDALQRVREELLQRLVEEDTPQATTTLRAQRRPDAPARSQHAALLMALPLVAVLVYALTGNPMAAGPSASAPPEDAARAQTEAMVAQLAAQLTQADNSATAGTAADTGSAEAWVWLAQLQAGLQRFAEAEQAYGRALARRPDVAQWLVDRADLYVVAHGTQDGEAERLVQRALQLAPTHPKALAIAGGLAFDRGEATQAHRLWGRARALLPAGSAFALELDRSIAAAEAEGARALNPATAISGTVQLAPELAAKASPESTVFLVVRAANQSSGPRMPLAVRRHRVADLPLRFTLDTSDAMTPSSSWAAGDALEVEVLVSHTGEARAQAGDLVAGPVGVKAGAEGLALVVGTVKR
jgi:cytochrome c-type biogenesis protein CcmH